MRRPRVVLAAAVVVVAVLGVLGIGVEGRLQPESLRIPGSEAARAADLLRDHFGDSAPFAILLEGPRAQLDRQGRHLVAVLRRQPHTTSISPWGGGPGLGPLRPGPRKALVLVDFHVSLDEAMASAVPRLEALLRQRVRPPVQARSAGYASVARAIRDESLAIAKHGEAIVTPILLVVLLLIFRSPIAAAIPLLFGAITVIASRGLMAITASFVGISGLSLSVATMIGLGLGVDYALLIVSRFREELAGGDDAAAAAATTRMTAGRTTVFAGSTLLIAMLVGVFLVPGALLVSLCSTVVAVIVLAVAGPWIVGPAVLTLIGHNIDRWRFGRRPAARTRWLVISGTALSAPVPAALLSCLLLLMFAAPAVTLATGPVTIEQLPRHNRTRLNVEAIEAAVGGGWIAPSVVVAVSRRGPITEPRRLAALERWQRQLAADPAVAAVVGPGPLARRVASLRREGRGLVQSGGGGEVARMVESVNRATGAVGRLRQGLARATFGAAALADGSGRAETGASLLANGLDLAVSGGGRADRALKRFTRGAHLLSIGQEQASLGTSVLGFGVDELQNLAAAGSSQAERLTGTLAGGRKRLYVAEDAAAETVQKLEIAWAELNHLTVDSGDPHVQALTAAIREALTAASGTDPVDVARYAPGYEGLPAELATLGRELSRASHQARTLRLRVGTIDEGVRLLHRTAVRLRKGMQKLEKGDKRLLRGSRRITSGARRITGWLTRLQNGTQRLVAGLSELRTGNGTLARGLSSAFRRTAPLQSKARQADDRVVAARAQLRTSSPGFFDSGYFALSALDGAPSRQRELAAQALDLEKGGQAAAMMVVSRKGIGDPASTSLDAQLQRRGSALAATTGLQIGVAGGVVQAHEYAAVTTARLPALVLAVTVITFLAMVVILRALPLAVIAVALNLLTVAAAFGVIRVLMLTPSSLPFGGTDHIDPVGAAGIFGVVFGLSIDYAVFLLARMRERWESSADNDAAIAFGLERTASVITGAATIMAVVFCAFASASVTSVAQFGIGLTVAVMLDATVIRLVLLPTLMRIVGPRVWWLPAPLAARLSSTSPSL